MPDYALKYREALALVRKYGVYENPARGKGSHRLWCRVVDGRMIRYPVPCHNEGYELSKAIIKAVRRRFLLTEADGVSDAEFYEER